MKYQGKSVAVLGLGRSGEAACALLVKLGARVTALDDAPREGFSADRLAALQALGVHLALGIDARADVSVYDSAVLSPGIDPKTDLVQGLVAKEVPLISEIELAYESSDYPVIAITGTNGKTTTTELAAAMLLGAGVRTTAGGNIGKPYSEIVSEQAELDVVTLEVSSFQLEKIERFRPDVSVWLNLTPDHLDRYEDAEQYRQAKLRVFENQTSDDWAVVNARDPLPPLPAKRITFSAYEPEADLHLRDDVIHYRDVPLLDPRETRLRGRHNTENLMAALGIGLARGLTAAQMAPPLRAYCPQPHRCEVVREVGGVLWINDSKATNLDALEKAIRAETRPIVLIAGGKDKGFEFDSLAELVGRRVGRAVLLGEMAPRILRAWQKHLPCETAASLPEAVQLASSRARAGDVVLFSPGTSSFDMFKSYVDRGNQFRALVQELPSSSDA
jgi:UDP-N-acetylmuramoylalanine--D-glutamate ligase